MTIILDAVSDPDWLKGREWELHTDPDLFEVQLQAITGLPLAKAWRVCQTWASFDAMPATLKATMHDRMGTAPRSR